MLDIFARNGGLVLSKSAYRPDIDGLRCFAVSSVVLFHAVAWAVPSGFAGVDIFFVISGYLIGGIIYREALAGQFSFATFYARRARRILPALLCAIAITLILGLAILATAEGKMLAGSSVWALLGFSNIFFWRHIDYFAPSADQNPLLMTWSLAVEEQFYLLFPPFMLLMLARARRHILPIILTLCAASFAVAIMQARYQPLAGFYLLPARIWELGAGVALAIIHANAGTRALPGMASTAVATPSMIGLIASFFIFDPATAWPGFATLLPVCCTLGLIHTRDSILNRYVLGHHWAVAIGLVSYSWYLLHWPLLTFVRISANGAQSDMVMLAVALLSLGLAYLSYRFVERPFRITVLPAGATLRYAGAALCVSVLLLQGLKAVDMIPARLSPMARMVQHEIRGGEACMAGFGTSAPLSDLDCRPRGARVAILGDSHAAALVPGLQQQLQSHGIDLSQFIKPSCPPMIGYGLTSELAPGATGECIRFSRTAVQAIMADSDIDTVILAGFWGAANPDKLRVERGGTFIPATMLEAMRNGLGTTVRALRSSRKTVVLVQDVPAWQEDVATFLLSSNIPARNALGRLARLDSTAAPGIEDHGQSRRLIADLAKQHPGIVLLDPFEQLCRARRCDLATRNGLPLYRDKQHLSFVGSRHLDWGKLPDINSRQSLALQQ